MLDLVGNVDRRLFCPLVLCNSPALADAARAAGATAQLMGWPEASERLLPSPAKARAVQTLLDERDVRIVHCNSIAPIKTIIPAARARRIPVVAHLHNIYSLQERLYMGVHQVSLAVGVSQTAVADLRADGMPDSRLRVIHNGVDPARLDRGQPSTLRDELGLAAGDTVLVALASLIPRKGIDVLIDAMAILRQTDPQVHLLVVGDGVARGDLEAQATRLGLERTVHFVGERADVGAVLRTAADIAVSAAREEAFPLNVLEAAYCALPVIASDIPPHRESIVDGSTGVLVEPDCAAAFARAVQQMVATPDRGRGLGARGADRVREQFLLGDYVARFERTYLELLDRPPQTYGWIAASTWPASYSRWLWTAAVRRARRHARRVPSRDDSAA